MAELFDTRLRAIRRDRAARAGPELFLYERAFADCLDRIGMAQRQFERALLIGCPDRDWPERLGALSRHVEVVDPGPLFAERANGAVITEDRWEPGKNIYDLVLAIGTLDTVDDLPLALRLIRYSMRGNALLIGAVSGGETLPQLRMAMRAADAVNGIAAAHVHPRIEAAALAPLLEQAGFVRPVADVDRVAVSYPSLDRLVRDLRAMGATNSLRARPRFIGRSAIAAAIDAFRKSADGSRTVESFEILHFAAWTANRNEAPLTVTQQELLTQLRLHPPRGRGPEEGGLDAIRRTLRMLGANERGATAIEYGLIAALIVMAMMAGLGSLGGGVHSTWGNMANKIENAG